jgi:hypothetical protein
MLLPGLVNQDGSVLDGQLVGQGHCLLFLG